MMSLDNLEAVGGTIKESALHLRNRIFPTHSSAGFTPYFASTSLPDPFSKMK